MAIIAFLAGGVIGAFCGLVGWLFFDLGLVAAILLYFSIGLGFGLAAIFRDVFWPRQHLHRADAEA